MARETLSMIAVVVARPACGSAAFISAIALLSLGASALDAQTVNPVPGFIQDLSGQFPFQDDFSFEQQIQIGTQGNSINNNPYEYAHALQFRPWLHYDGIPNITLTGSASYIIYYAVPSTSYYRHDEWRDTLMVTVKQVLPGGSLYEQVRGELLSFHDSHGALQHLPRMRVRFGQNLYLGEGGGTVARPYLGLYEETVLQFPRPSYSHVTFASARLFAGAGFELGTRTQVLLGFKSEGEVSSSGSTVTMFFGPAFSIEYNFRVHHLLHENHHRTTAFKNF